MAGYGVIFAVVACAVDFHFALTPVNSSKEICDMVSWLSQSSGLKHAGK